MYYINPMPALIFLVMTITSSLLIIVFHQSDTHVMEKNGHHVMLISLIPFIAEVPCGVGGICNQTVKMPVKCKHLTGTCFIWEYVPGQMITEYDFYLGYRLSAIMHTVDGCQCPILKSALIIPT